MIKPHTLANKNKELFLDTFKDVYEHSAWIIKDSYEIAKANELYDDVQKFHILLSQIVLNSTKSQQDLLIKAHPMLAKEKLAFKELTLNSQNEQKSASLDSCSKDELEKFTSLNTKYFEKFGFPFIMAIKNKSKEEILESFERRIKNTKEQEHEESLNQINQIALLRIKDIYEK
ncbi:2-oxo-4-hydroxy-4-carboxy-5-ureidoimidazoline decarboxylase [Arcobacter roscoffensis]|uniref:2-oxo-4-hydroxy-4-carboxy-5-ureidoimidazoline decarboxylase n=1 Tax=Arcobacter roscoffensis TaxID=2961520 RepID=A0ABY5E5M3_9BACT|nr:2-oxo-4-hydroxy-4-carboxy-5-ureidoimidazoline decarboxylase [Arcobacter roscoffensis]UTJ07457.1 2-oxo-4-hydroxy-4-carboxy-5-ureidoimidazoline decarboxylase [Arcobacter roscoffensis]